MKRRNFLAGVVATASGLLLPYEPKRVYSFIQPRRPFGMGVLFQSNIVIANPSLGGFVCVSGVFRFKPAKPFKARRPSPLLGPPIDMKSVGSLI